MSQRAHKFVIGLTGNIGTGKSVVRRMLEHLGAFGIDADDYSHRAIAKGAPGFRPIVQHFGEWVVGENGEIDRARLGRMVFSDPDGLAFLEGVIHPLVLRAVDWMVERSKQPVVVVEAIKLFETDLSQICDSKWVVTASEDVQLLRLMQKRGMTEAEARQRILAQSAQELKAAAANVVIHNDHTPEDTWRQVMTAWSKVVPSAVLLEKEHSAVELPQGEKAVVRGKPRDATEMAFLLEKVRPGAQLSVDDVLAAFGEKAFWLMRIGDRLVGWVGWRVENLVASVTELVIDSTLPVQEALPELVHEMEQASCDLQCEAALVFVEESLKLDALWQELGYDRRTPQSLGVLAWQDAAKEMMKPGQVLYFKQLRQDRVLRPI